MLNRIWIQSSELGALVRRRPGNSHRFVSLFVILWGFHAAMAQTFVINPPTLSFTAAADSTALPPAQSLQVTSAAGSVPFVVLIERVNLTGTIPPFVAVNPSSGTTPATVAVSLIPGVTQYFGPTTRTVTLDFYKSGPNNTLTLPYTTATVSFTITPPPLPPTISSIVNAATLQPGISPGGIFTIFGEHLAFLDRGGSSRSVYDPREYYVPFGLGGTHVTFNGRYSPMLYSDANQINAVVPFQVAGQTSVEVVLTHYSYTTTFTVPIIDTSPGIFTFSGTGTGQGSILNTNGSINSALNPAPAGSIIQIFGAGAGLWNSSFINGQVVHPEPPYPVPVAPVSVMIGGQPAVITYAGGSPDQIIGVIQVNAVVPIGTSPGDQPVVLTIGNNSNAQQRVTVAVQ